MNPNDIFEQAVTITKAYAHDIVVKHNQELKEENEKLKDRVKYLESLIKEYADKIINTPLKCEDAI